MKESVKNIFRWLSLPFVFLLVLFLVHALAILLNGGAVSRMTYDGGPLPIVPALILYLFAGFVSSFATVYACKSVAPSNKRIVVWVSGILLILLCVLALILAIVAPNNTLELIRKIINNVGSIAGSIMSMKLILENEDELD